MKNWLRSEEVIQFLASIVVFSRLDFAWWVYPALILVPDLSMIGYVVSPSVGAVVYNLAHHKGLALAVALAGWFSGTDWLTLTGVLLFGHSSMDRILGYGLKYPDSFQHTHLGLIGRGSGPSRD